MGGSRWRGRKLSLLFSVSGQLEHSYPLQIICSLEIGGKDEFRICPVCKIFCDLMLFSLMETTLVGTFIAVHNYVHCSLRVIQSDLKDKILFLFCLKRMSLMNIILFKRLMAQPCMSKTTWKCTGANKQITLIWLVSTKCMCHVRADMCFVWLVCCFTKN